MHLSMSFGTSASWCGDPPGFVLGRWPIYVSAGGWFCDAHTHALPVKQTHCLPMPITLGLMWSSDTWWANYHCLCVYLLSSYNSYAFNRLSHSVACTWAYFKMWVTPLINDQVQIAETLLGMLLVVCLYSHNRPHGWVIRPGVEHLHTVTDRGS